MEEKKEEKDQSDQIPIQLHDFLVKEIAESTKKVFKQLTENKKEEACSSNARRSAYIKVFNKITDLHRKYSPQPEEDKKGVIVKP